MNTRDGFTLVEMLVVAAILSLLVGITLPMLGRSKANARQTVCLSNLAQLGHASDERTLDRAGRFFEYREGVAAAPSIAAGIRWWFGFEPLNGLTINRPLDHDGGPLGPYLAGIGERLQCAAFPYESVNHIPKFSRPAASYGYNWRLSGMKKIGASEVPDEIIRPQTRSRYSQRTSEVFLFADSVFFEPNPNPLAFFEGYYIAWQSNTAALSGYAHFRHGETANVAFLDGHASPQALRGDSARSAEGSKAGNLAANDGGNAVYGD
jgi:prepilin-type N-terminal cleavage/methylation domain-containing protein/prepilin-type processing-associated H-X9-DG protein